MTQLQVFQLTATMVKEGKTDAEIRKCLFNTQGVRLAQIKKAMKLIACD